MTGPDRVGDDRGAFMRRVRAALGRAGPAAPPAPPGIDETILRLAGPEDDLAALFRASAEAVGLRVHACPAPDLEARLAELLRETGAASVAISMHDGAASRAAHAAAARGGVTIADWRATSGLDAHYDVDVGITDAEAALAESGTIIVSSGPAHSRGTFIVPPVHIAVLSVDRILPDMIDFWRRLEETSGDAVPASMVMITGPSKTADIEGILVTGVHGPGAVHVILVKDDES